MNPVLRKELRTLLRERRGYLAPLFYALCLVVTSGLVVWPSIAYDASDPDRQLSNLGHTVIGVVAVLQWLAVIALAPLVGAGMISGERERGTWIPLLVSPLDRARIGYGKLVAGVAYVLVLLAVSVPFSALAYQLGGVELGALLGLYGLQALLGALLVALGLLVSSAFERTWSSAMLAVTLPGLLALTNVALWYALEGQGVSELEGVHRAMPGVEPWPDWPQWIPVFNPLYGTALFFGSSRSVLFGPVGWGLHAGVLVLATAAVMVWLSVRLRRIRG